MKMTFAMVAKSLFGARLKEEDIDLISHDHLDGPGIYGSANHSALPESLVRRLG